jgi:trk system potassium uptake protein TrkH
MMNIRYHVILRYVGFVLLINAAFLAFSAGISAFRHESDLLPLLYSSLVLLLFGIFPPIFVPSTTHIRNDEGLIIVVSSWLLCCLAGVLPYVLYGGEFTFTNAWFESVSGFTTTGSSVLTDVEALPFGLLFWRASTHWIGGIGIIVFVLSVLPTISQAAMVLSRAEISPLAKNNFQYRAQKTLRILLTVYVSLTLLETISLIVCGMSLFDAVTHSFATIATGGFSVKSLSIAHYDSIAIESVISIFMILSGIHFGLLFLAAGGKFRAMWRSTVVRYYIGALFAGVILVSISIYGRVYSDWIDALRHASFQVISLGTSTGFASADSSGWPAFAILIMIFFTLQCACSGSTSGGIKTERIVILLKSIRARILKLRHPKAVVSVRFEGTFVNEDVLASSLLFICIYLLVVFLATVSLTAFGVDILSAFSGSAAAMGNVGPGFGRVGSLANYSHLPGVAKWILTMVMLLGRLEIFGLILCFSAGFSK